MTTPIHVAYGSHGNRANSQRCAGEWRYFLCHCDRCVASKEAGILLTHTPLCSPATLARVIPWVNDRLTDAGRQRMASRIPLIPSVEADADPDVLRRVELRVALWCARSVEHFSKDERVRACNDVTERFLAGQATSDELAEMTREAWASAGASAGVEKANRVARAAAWAATAAREGAAPSMVSAAEGARAGAAAGAAAAAAAAEDDALLDWLDRLLDVWAKIAAEEGLLGSCGWIDPDEYVQAGGS